MSPHREGGQSERASTPVLAASAPSRRRCRRTLGRRSQNGQALAKRAPYPHNRAAIADLLGAEEAALWPGADGTLTARVRPDELGALYPHRRAIPREVWTRFFASAKREIGILADSALFLGEDKEILRLLADKGCASVAVRIALTDPESRQTADGEEKEIGDAVPTAIRTALALYRPLNEVENVEIRLHQTVLYNSIYCSDDHLIVNQHAHGIPAADAPVFSLRNSPNAEMAALYVGSFERVWGNAMPLARPTRPT